jgi:hypothetical protein
MRQWMVDPKIMCRQHLLGEHVEHHMFVGAINKNISIDGYLRDNLLEPSSLHSRHVELVKEMESRGYNHKSPLLSFIPFKLEEAFVKIDKEASLKELLRRCPECRARHETIYGELK